MSLWLADPPHVLKARFHALLRPFDIAALLDVPFGDFFYWTYRVPPSRRYTTFYIEKHSGAPRRIDAPELNIKILQQKLNQVLRAVYVPKRCVHGFVPGRSVLTNAQAHAGRRHVFNIDLRDFFPSINFGRVRGMFMGKPYRLPPKVATVLANLCCFDRRLPQGAPTSPVVSNMICARMDSQILGLAYRHRCTYTRYADDMTFSTSRRPFPAEMATLNDLGQVAVGAELRGIIEGNGFRVHPEKIWLRGRDRRQEVTGLTVNVEPNVRRRYVNQIRAMLHAAGKYGLPSAQSEREQRYDHKHRAPWNDPPSFERALQGKIEYLGMVRGHACPKYLKMLDDLGRLAPHLFIIRGTPRERLLRRYRALLTSPNHQARGYQLQALFEEGARPGRAGRGGISATPDRGGICPGTPSLRGRTLAPRFPASHPTTARGSEGHVQAPYESHPRPRIQPRHGPVDEQVERHEKRAVHRHPARDEIVVPVHHS
ncbi:MAG: RNA-directed DNA polymerase, partial [Planctomycetes bacterium]|nr:RNA-directed DNA polymerase [Planctomycetota bacterium]